MPYPEIKKINDAVTLVVDALKTEFGKELEVRDETDERIETYKTNHPNGAVLVLYDGAKYSDRNNENIVFLERNMRIACLLQVRVEKGLMYKNDMIERMTDAVSGLKFETFGKTDKVFPATDEYNIPQQEKDKTFYEHTIVFIVPSQYEEKNYLNQ
ncbi:MAG: hypothetical protein Kow0098_03680 [Ignavibacteriaceae bacterium]